jgi:hypothetical protein
MSHVTRHEAMADSTHIAVWIALTFVVAGLVNG